MTKWIIGLVSISFIVVLGSYIYEFNNMVISDDTSKWSDFGSYIGGTLGPLLTFISVLLLIKTFELQKFANERLENDIKRSKKQAKLNSFEQSFFNLIQSQQTNFKEFALQVEEQKVTGVEAVDFLEQVIINLNNANATKERFKLILDLYDKNRKVFNATRIFYVLCKIVEDSLKEEDGFTSEERSQYYQTLIYFTDYNLLRLICISIVLDGEKTISGYLVRNKNLQKIGKSSGLSNYLIKLRRRG
ncbi:MAG: hypothetical protein JXQ95_13210 [Alteromonas stellipolaris]|uniref:hypothetical protein n=1 Tax=Alteromonas stellipolaris TaxID=233316 RepID=UPI003B8B5957